MKYFLFFLSWALVAFGQPAWIVYFAPFAALMGYALFWKSMLMWERPAQRFNLAVVWFASVQAIQLSWMTSTAYMGPLILAVYVFLLVAMGLQFGLLSWMIEKEKPLSILSCAGLAGFWTLLEWIRLFPCTGFPWNPVGLSLSASTYSLQSASLFGIYGLTFWVIFVNLAALRMEMMRTKQTLFLWTGFALLPFVFGAVQQSAFSKGTPAMSVLLVQTALLPHQKDYFPTQPDGWIPPLDQWERILNLIEEANSNPIDLIVLPEASLPFQAYRSIYPFSDIKRIWIKHFGEEAEKDFPPLAQRTSRLFKKQEEWRVSNAFWIQALANHYGCEIVAGLDDQDHDGKRFNAAFHFLPHQEAISRYEKRVLVPVGEYVPLKACAKLSQFIADQFGIGDSFDPGSEAKIFSGQVPLGVSICYEETFSEMIRQSRNNGAKLLVNLSNDGWFPESKLAQQHFDHGIIRAVENGVPEIRACNTGITGGVDCFGRLLGRCQPTHAEALFLKVPLQTNFTLYSFWGDWAILGLSGFLTLFLFRKRDPCSK